VESPAVSPADLALPEVSSPNGAGPTFDIAVEPAFPTGGAGVIARRLRTLLTCLRDSGSKARLNRDRPNVLADVAEMMETFAEVSELGFVVVVVERRQRAVRHHPWPRSRARRLEEVQGRHSRAVRDVPPRRPPRRDHRRRRRDRAGRRRRHDTRSRPTARAARGRGVCQLTSEPDLSHPTGHRLSRLGLAAIVGVSRPSPSVGRSRSVLSRALLGHRRSDGE
jgi:hypothetical protein